MQDGRREGEVEQHAEAGLEGEEFAVDREAPAVDAAQRMDLAPEVLRHQRLFMQRNAEVVAAAQPLEVCLRACSAGGWRTSGSAGRSCRTSPPDARRRRC